MRDTLWIRVPHPTDSHPPTLQCSWFFKGYWVRVILGRLLGVVGLLITHCSTTRRRKGSMTSADLAKSRHRTSDDPPRGRSRSTSGDLPNPYWNLGSPPTNLPRRGRGPSTDLADLRAQISSISNPPVSIDDTADCNLELRVGMSVT